MKYIQERLGHSSMQVTADVYAHVSQNLKTVASVNSKSTCKIFMINLWVICGCATHLKMPGIKLLGPLTLKGS
ncbi:MULTISPECIES: hypothetical protein [Brevibacillus]|uniref:hypothetical protein n=1 Tax=Brevibacillus TaxID=55080 RepID=UPI003877BBAF